MGNVQKVSKRGYNSVKPGLYARWYYFFEITKRVLALLHHAEVNQIAARNLCKLSWFNFL